MKITKRQLRRIIKEEKNRLLSEQPSRVQAAAITADLESAILQIFFEDGQVSTADVFDRLRMDGHSDEDIDWAIEVSTR
jgi:hypothetical protein